MPHKVLTVVSSLLLVSGAVLVADHGLGTTSPDVELGAEAAPPAVGTPETGTPAEATTPPPGTPDRSGVPVQLVIPIPSSNHPDGVTAPVTADPLLPNGDLFVPSDPGIISWANEDAPPGATFGTAILVGHVNYNGEVGALSDLAEYAAEHVGATFTVGLADGRQLTYRITGGAQYDKDQLAAQPELRREIYDQESAFGEPPGTGRLVLVSCGGAFDNRTGNYQDNVFVFAMPVE
jgi:hypothetical protein